MIFQFLFAIKHIYVEYYKNHFAQLGAEPRTALNNYIRAALENEASAATNVEAINEELSSILVTLNQIFQ